MTALKEAVDCIEAERNVKVSAYVAANARIVWLFGDSPSGDAAGVVNYFMCSDTVS